MLPVLLLLDSDRTGPILVEGAARGRFRLLAVRRPDEALALIAERAAAGEPVDLVVHHVRCPPVRALDFLRRLRALDADLVFGGALRARSLPVVLRSDDPRARWPAEVAAVDPTAVCLPLACFAEPIRAPWLPALEAYRRRLVAEVGPWGEAAGRDADGGATAVDTALCRGRLADVRAACERLQAFVGRTEADWAAAGRAAAADRAPTPRAAGETLSDRIAALLHPPGSADPSEGGDGLLTAAQLDALRHAVSCPAPSVAEVERLVGGGVDPLRAAVGEVPSEGGDGGMWPLGADEDAPSGRLVRILTDEERAAGGSGGLLPLWQLNDLMRLRCPVHPAETPFRARLRDRRRPRVRRAPR